jgi:hypothetical protein
VQTMGPSSRLGSPSADSPGAVDASNEDTCGLCKTMSCDPSQRQIEHQGFVLCSQDHGESGHPLRDEQGQGEDVDRLHSLRSR